MLLLLSKVELRLDGSELLLCKEAMLLLLSKVGLRLNSSILSLQGGEQQVEHDYEDGDFPSPSKSRPRSKSKFPTFQMAMRSGIKVIKAQSIWILPVWHLHG
jgi:hypothetical protein